jgi:hypothetical protein
MRWHLKRLKRRMLRQRPMIAPPPGPQYVAPEGEQVWEIHLRPKAERSDVRLGTDEDLREDFGSSPLQFGVPVRPRERRWRRRLRKIGGLLGVTFWFSLFGLFAWQEANEPSPTPEQIERMNEIGCSHPNPYYC